MADERRRTIYLQENFLDIIRDRGIENLSKYINTMNDRYMHIINQHVPNLDAEDYTELFEHMADYEFGTQDIDVELVSFPVILEFHDVSKPVIRKIKDMGDLERLALIDLIERSQNKLIR